MRKWISLSIALLIAFGASLFFIPGNAAAARKDQSLYSKASASYERLKKDVRKRRYRSEWQHVMAGFDAVADKYPNSPYAGSALFMKAEAAYSMYRVSRTKQDLADAAAAYERYTDKYPNTKNVAEALSKAGSIRMELGDRKKAAESYRELASRFPKSSYAAEARDALKTLPADEKPGDTGKPAPIPEPRPAAEPQPPVTASLPEQNYVIYDEDDDRYDPPVETQNAPEAAPAPQPTGSGRYITLANADTPDPNLSRVSDIRHWSNPESTRVVIELDSAFLYKGHLIKSPDRLFFDIKGACISKTLSETPIDINDGVLKAVRTSQFDKDTVRVVLDLDNIGDYKALMLPDPPRLVVDVFSADKHDSAVCKTTDTNGPAGTASAKTDSKDSLSLARQMGLCVRKIVIDPGHGGKDSGAVGKNGLMEKDVVLDIAKRLRDLVESELDCKVVMTRDKDVFVDLDARPVVARESDADLFISIHANASTNRSARGVETYLLNLTKDREIMTVAARENATTMKNMSDINSILFELVLDNKRDESLNLAHKVQESLVKDLDVSDKGVKQGPFLVLYGASVPSILTEIGFISNPQEEKQLRSPKYRQEIAKAIFDGIRDYVVSTRPTAISASR